MSTLTSINPFTQEVNATFETISDEEIKQKIELAHSAYLSWRETSFDERKNLFYKLAEVIEVDIENVAKLQTLEMGMLLSASKTGMQAMADLIRWFADNAEDVLGDKEFDVDGSK